MHTLASNVHKSICSTPLHLKESVNGQNLFIKVFDQCYLVLIGFFFIKGNIFFPFYNFSQRVRMKVSDSLWPSQHKDLYLFQTEHKNLANANLTC